jgi:hypothetical protein
MSKLDKMFAIQWYGPFSFGTDDCYENLRDWEQKHPDERGFCIYYIYGKPPQKKKGRSYIGITLNKNGVVSKRYSNDMSHKIHQLRDKEVWVGRFADKNKHSRKDSELCESLLIAYLDPELNIKKKKFYPDGNVALINRWYTKDAKPRQRRTYEVQKLVPDIIICDDEGIWVSEQLLQGQKF